MTKIPLYFGYTGVIPFFFFMLLAFVVDDPTDMRVVNILQTSYATMILSFLGGIHWGQALPTSNHQQMAFAMTPTIVGLFLMGMALIFESPFVLLFLAGMFWVVYYADTKLMPLDYIAEGYFTFRRNLSIAVSTILVLTFLILL